MSLSLRTHLQFLRPPEASLARFFLAMPGGAHLSNSVSFWQAVVGKPVEEALSGVMAPASLGLGFLAPVPTYWGRMRHQPA